MTGIKNGAVALLAVLAVAACSGDKGDKGDPGATGATGATGAAGATGASGAPGTAGKDATLTAKAESCEVCHATAGTEHQNVFDTYINGLKNPNFAISNVSLVSSANATDPTKWDAVLTFTLTKNGAPWTGQGDLSGLLTKTVYFNTFVPDATRPTTGTFPNAGVAVSTFTEVGPTSPGVYSSTVTGLSSQLEAGSGELFMALGDSTIMPSPAGKRLSFFNNVAEYGRTYGTMTYASTANVSGCARCHPDPYAKHAYILGIVPAAGGGSGLPDFVSCKSCHYETRDGHDAGWQYLVDDPAGYAANNGTPPAAIASQYAYKAKLMNDVHMSHAMEFEYPQSMSNCVTCHAGKLDKILTDDNFQLATCKSCHPVTGTGGTRAGRAPALVSILPASIHGSMDLYAGTVQCNLCHSSGGGIGPVFSAIHKGYDDVVYASAPSSTADSSTKYASSITTQVDAVAFDATKNQLTVNFSVVGAASNAMIKPTVVVSLYGYDTKDFLVSGHVTQPDGTSNLEWTEGAMQRSNPTKSANSSRLAITPGTAAAGVTAWVATADLTLWASKLTDGSVKRAEVAILPALGQNQSVAPQNDPTKANYNPYLAIKGVTRTIDLVGKVLLANDDPKAYGRNITDGAKCNACHDALGTTFHTPNYGSAGPLGCRVCHFSGAGAFHLEMQSRSLDSWIHAIHSFQQFDVSGIKFSDPVQTLYYDLGVEATFPKFTLLACQACHNPGTYEVPDQQRSMPGILSASATNATWDRTIGTYQSYVTGPAARSCGACHRAKAINEDDAAKLASLYSHWGSFSTMLPDDGTGMDNVLANAIQTVFHLFQF